MHHPATRGPLILLSRKFKQRQQQQQREWPKINRFDKQNNNFARASRFFVHFFAVTARLQHEKWLISR